MISIGTWMADLTTKLKEAFDSRLLFVGLQGSYRRNEATESSDIEAVVILDELAVGDLITYRKIIETMPENEKACGFVSGRRELLNWPRRELLNWPRRELLNWPRHELFQFERDTDALHGTLKKLLPEISRADIAHSVKTGASGIYHACCHTWLHGEKAAFSDALKDFCKGAFFVLQGLHYLRKNEYIGSKKELLPRLEGTEREILEISMSWDRCAGKIADNPNVYYEKIIGWCSKILADTPLD